MNENGDSKMTDKKNDQTTTDEIEEAKIERQPAPKFRKEFFLFLAFIFGITVLIALVSVTLDYWLYIGNR